MDILFVADNFPPEKNAQASRVYERACYWVEWGHRVTVITCAPNFPEGTVYAGYRNSWYRIENISGIRVVRVKTFIARNAGTALRSLDFLSFMLSSLVAGLFQSKPDVIAATSPQFFAAVSACLLSRVKRAPFVMEVSDLWPESIVAVGAMEQSRAIQLLERVELAMYRKAKRVVLLTCAFRENLMRRGVPLEKLEVIRNGADLRRYAPQTKDTGLARQLSIEGCFTVGYIGTFGMAHALENVLHAAAMIEASDVRFLLVGTGAEREKLVAKAKTLKLKNVVFVPAQPKEQMPRYWSLCDVSLVHLRNTRLFKTVIPSKIFESMAMGLPVLLSAPEGEATDIVKQYDAGICVPAEDPRALAEAVLRLKENVPLRLKLATASLAAAPLHSREAQAREMLTVLERIGSLSETIHPAISVSGQSES